LLSALRSCDGWFIGLLPIILRVAWYIGCNRHHCYLYHSFLSESSSSSRIMDIPNATKLNEFDDSKSWKSIGGQKVHGNVRFLPI
jgi:hypothetical protein